VIAPEYTLSSPEFTVGNNHKTTVNFEQGCPKSVMLNLVRVEIYFKTRTDGIAMCISVLTQGMSNLYAQDRNPNHPSATRKTRSSLTGDPHDLNQKHDEGRDSPG
jgi:hypothetical protein